MALEKGAVLQGRYRVLSLLGEGGMGAVYRAWDTRLNIAIALKELIPQPSLEATVLDGLREQFHQEASILARLNHPNLVRVSDFFDEDGNTYLVMAFVEGESLAEHIARRGRVPEPQVRAWAEALLKALAYCHGQGILHRDIKPQNVILQPDGQPVLVDFGLVKLWNPYDPRTRTVVHAMGTPQYAPPEQYDAGLGHTDPRSDLYSLGATLYHALTGECPPTATARIVNPTALLPIRQLNPHVSPQLETTLMQALELQPGNRFHNAAEMQRALASPPLDVVASTTAPQEQTVAMPPSPSPARRSLAWPWLAAGGILFLLLCGGGGVAGVRLLQSWTGSHSPTSTPFAAVADQQTVTAPAPEVTAPPKISETPTSAAAVSPTETIAATSTPLATASVPTTTPLPTETPTPETCPPVTGPFAEVWEAHGWRLGCATGDSFNTWTAEQPFINGLMFWRQDSNRIYALFNRGDWRSYANTWSEGDPTYSCPESAPSETPPTPLRGFGKVWCTATAVRTNIGDATAPERGYNAQLQNFENGLAIRSDSGQIYLLYTAGSWVQP